MPPRLISDIAFTAYAPQPALGISRIVIQAE